MTGSIETEGCQWRKCHAIYIQGGGNGAITIRDNVSITATGTNSYAINLNADTNHLDLELGDQETITGRIKLSGAGVDGSNQARTHSIAMVGTGGIITTALNDIYLIEP